MSQLLLLFPPQRAILAKGKQITQNDLPGLIGVHQLPLVTGQRVRQIRLIRFNHISPELQLLFSYQSKIGSITFRSCQEFATF